MSCTATVRKSSGVAIVDLGGKFTIGEGFGVIRKTVNELLDEGERKLVLNLQQVTYLDSAGGIGELVGAYISSTRQGAQIRLLHAGKRIETVLRIVGLDKIFEIHEDEGAALHSFDQPSVEAATDHAAGAAH